MAGRRSALRCRVISIKYSADPDEVLPEAGTLETGKSYREKKAKSLIKKIVTVLRSVYWAYLDLSRRFNDVQRSYERAWSKVNFFTARVNFGMKIGC